jgi:bacteriochlorophyll 4-vinyl reductase
MWCLPSRKASRLLAAAIARNAWTFAGTGRFSV